MILQSGLILSIVTTSGEFAGIEPRRFVAVTVDVGEEQEDKVDDNADVEEAGVLPGEGELSIAESSMQQKKHRL